MHLLPDETASTASAAARKEQGPRAALKRALSGVAETIAFPVQCRCSAGKVHVASACRHLQCLITPGAGARPQLSAQRPRIIKGPTAAFGGLMPSGALHG